MLSWIPNYFVIKHIHQSCAALSGCLFFLRGVWTLNESPVRHQRWLAVVPHLADTILLGCAVTMLVLRGQSPFAQSWLIAKLIALVCYVALGTIALKRGKSKPVRACAFVAALLVFAYIGAVALTKQVWIPA